MEKAPPQQEGLLPPRTEGLLTTTPNPFESKAPWTGVMKLKSFIIFFTLFPIRLVVLIVGFLTCTLLARLAMCCGGAPLTNDRGCLRHMEALSPARLRIMWPVTPIIRMILWSFGFWRIKYVDHRQKLKKLEGKRLVSGNDIVTNTMTVAKAQKHALTLKGCKGFCFEGADTGGEMQITFATSYETNDEGGEGWTTYRVEPRPNIVAVAPHMNPCDGAFVALLFPPLPAEVAKIELTHGAMGALTGAMAVASQGIFVDRNKPESRQACKEAIAERADVDKWSGAPTLICPEGTTTNGKALVNFKPGAFSSGHPVLPICLHYHNPDFNIGWTGDYAFNMPGLMLRMMLSLYTSVTVEIFEPQVATSEEKGNPKLFASNVRAVMAKSLGVPTTEHSYADVTFSMKALRAKVANDFVVDEVNKKFGITTDQILEWLKDFKKYDTDKSGFISFDEFAAVMSKGDHKVSQDALRRLFDLFNTDQTGHLSYREIIQVFSVLSPNSTDLTSRKELAFLLCDPQGNKLKKEVLKDSLEKAWAENAGDRAVLDEILSKAPDELSFEDFSKLADEQPSILDNVLKFIPAIFDKAHKQEEVAAGKKEVEMAKV